MSVISVTMIYTVFAIICVAISSTVDVDPIFNDISAEQMQTQGSGAGSTHRCADNPLIGNYLKNVVNVRLSACLVAGKWSVIDTNQKRLSVAAYCCSLFDFKNVTNQWHIMNCGVAPSDEIYKNIIAQCGQSGHKFSDTYCDKQPGNRTMTADCTAAINIWTTGPDPNFPTKPPATNSTKSPSSFSAERPLTTVWVLLAVIVVSIAVDLYGFH